MKITGQLKGQPSSANARLEYQTHPAARCLGRSGGVSRDITGDTAAAAGARGEPGPARARSAAARPVMTTVAQDGVDAVTQQRPPLAQLRRGELRLV